MLNIISRSYCSSIVSGPKKVVSNLIEGLELIGYPFVINKRLDATKRLWIHDDIDALAQINNLPNYVKVVAGPNLFIAPRFIPSSINFSKVILSFPCLWTKQFWQDFGFNKCPIEICPSGIDTNLFLPSTEEKEIVTVYFKKRDKSELIYVTDLLSQKKIKFQIVEYGKYDERFFQAILKKTKLVIWLGCSESQGIALQEILACNIPIIVCEGDNINKNLVSKNGFNSQEASYKNATSAPYFSDQCGVKVNSLEKLDSALKQVMNNLTTFKPREYVVANFNLEKQAKDFLNIFNTNYGLTYNMGLNEGVLKNGDWINNSVWFKLKTKLKDEVKNIKKFL